MQKTICELFAGVGGFRLGFDRLNSGWETVWFSQWEPAHKKQAAHDCYIRHFGDCADLRGEYHTNEDITTVDKTAIPDHTLLVGGFPCQDYSVASPLSAAPGITGAKGMLWWQVRDILAAKQPAFCLLENVDRLLQSPKSQRGRDFGLILGTFAEYGYQVEWRVVNSAQYGAAQRRKRTFIFAYRKDTVYAATMQPVDAERVIRTDGFMAQAFPVDDMGDMTDTQLVGTLSDISDNFVFDFKNAGYMCDRHVYTAKVVEQEETPILLGDVLEASADSKYYIPANMVARWEYLKGAKKIPRTAKTGFEYFYTEGAMAFPDPLDKPSRTLVTSEGKVDRTTHIIKDPVTGDLRKLTPVELERLQGFDDNWTAGMSEHMRRFCMGNALVVPMVTRMGAVLDNIIADEP